jgi:hypothetical protein
MHRFHPVKRYSTSYQHRKAVTIAATVVATLAIFTGAAFAGDVWFTAQGHANSTDTVGSGWTYHVDVVAGSLTDGLTPGATGSGIPITVTNDNLESVEFDGVIVSVVNTSNAGDSNGGCDANDFTVRQPTSYSDSMNSDFEGEMLPFEMPAGDVATADGATVTLNPSASTDCAGATVNLSEVVGSPLT